MGEVYYYYNLLKLTCYLECSSFLIDTEDSDFRTSYDIETNVSLRPSHTHAACRAIGNHTHTHKHELISMRFERLRLASFGHSDATNEQDSVSRNCEMTENVSRLLQHVSRGNLDGTF